jgi:hypothetical protein
MIKAPLDILADKFRGYAGAATDTVLRPDVVYKACEALMPHILANALAGADPDKNVPVTIWAHRGCVPFISREMFDNIFWPTLKPIFLEIIRRGHQILFYGEGNWERHYDSLAELPAGGLIYHLDKGCPLNTVKKLKDKFALSGGVSYDVLARGTPDDVRGHLKELFSAVKDGGGYILDAGALMLSDIKPENVRAAVEYTMEHGVYSQSTPAKPMEAPMPAEKEIPPGHRPPNVCRSWEVESAEYKNLAGDAGLVRDVWEKTDAAAYNYLWTTVLW